MPSSGAGTPLRHGLCDAHHRGLPRAPIAWEDERDGVPQAGGVRVSGVGVLWLCGGIQFVRLAVTMATMTWWPTYL
ncbi:MAG TPA: hypothetical protein VFT01_10910, partial [Homoserinimonas sp.]|nr:hypothetical protein [Homoserinimonas sp.]